MIKIFLISTFYGILMMSIEQQIGICEDDRVKTIYLMDDTKEEKHD